ncbi:MAG TPA: amidase family protein [Actinomycetota bacterium]|nr:amidase family protein [Actinomycetota bacterium]
MDLDDPCFLPAYELLARYRARELSPVEVTRAALERIERLDPLVNAFVTVTPELALDQARRAEAAWLAGEAAAPLAGVPASIKDLFPTKGIRTTRGSVRWRDWVPDFDAPSVGRMRAAGVVLLGKTNTPEAGWKGSTSNRVAGITRNPWDLGRTPGGSSGGAAVAVATGMGSLGLGSDGGGSVRIPAAFTGVYGLKPSHALVPGSGTGPFEHLGHVGPIARTVRDAALLLTVLAGPDERDRLSYDTPRDYLSALRAGVAGLRVAWCPSLVAGLDAEPAVRDTSAEGVRELERLGAVVEEIPPPLGTEIVEAHRTLLSTGLAALYPDLEEVEAEIEPDLAATVRSGRGYSGLEVVVAQVRQLQVYDAIRVLFERCDLLATPAVSVTAFQADRDFPEQVNGRPGVRVSWTPYSFPFNHSGHPAASVPCGTAPDGLPVGLQLVGGWRRDDLVLRASAALEQARPWTGPLLRVTRGLLASPGATSR